MPQITKNYQCFWRMSPRIGYSGSAHDAKQARTYAENPVKTELSRRLFVPDFLWMNSEYVAEFGFDPQSLPEN